MKHLSWPGQVSAVLFQALDDVAVFVHDVAYLFRRSNGALQTQM